MAGPHFTLSASTKDLDSRLSGLFSSSLGQAAPVTKAPRSAGTPRSFTTVNTSAIESGSSGVDAAVHDALQSQSPSTADPAGDDEPDHKYGRSLGQAKLDGPHHMTRRATKVTGDAGKRKRKRHELGDEARDPKETTVVDDAVSSEDGSIDLPGEESASLTSESVPAHESLHASLPESILERESRTVFLGNVSTEAIVSRGARKALLHHLTSVLEQGGPNAQRVESLRFRSIPFSTVSMPKRAAFITKSLMSATARSCNAYAVFNDAAGADQVVSRLNGSMILGRHLRVDSVTHPTAIQHRRCVFVGNLNFVDDEASAPQAGDQGEGATAGRRAHTTAPLDVEEGLWAVFSAGAGPVESVRMVRDSATRVGKGFAYVQFQNENDVEAALLLSGKKHPPMLPRKLRVSRCNPPSKSARGNWRSDQGMYSRPDKQGRGRAARIKGLGSRGSRVLGEAGSSVTRQPSTAQRSGYEGPGAGQKRKWSAQGQDVGAEDSSARDHVVFEGKRATAKVGKVGAGSKSRPERRSKNTSGRPRSKKRIERGRTRAGEWRKASRVTN